VEEEEEVEEEEKEEEMEEEEEKVEKEEEEEEEAGPEGRPCGSHQLRHGHRVPRGLLGHQQQEPAPAEEG